MYGTAKDLKDKATNAKRTATALRSFASSGELNLADRGLLLKTAQVLEAFGESTRRAAKAKKTAEEARAKALARATEAAKVALATWSVTTIADKIVLVNACGHWNGLVKGLSENQDNPALVRRDFNFWVEEARRELPASAAWKAVTNSQDINDVMAGAREKFEAARTDAKILALAARFAPYLDAAAQEAA